MKRASITEAKNGLSALLDRVKHGEIVLIEDRGIPVAQLAPAVGVPLGHRGRLAQLERQGIVQPPRSTATSKLLLKPPLRAPRPIALSRLVQAERQEGW
jgi:prevent-host-death family protein